MSNVRQLSFAGGEVSPSIYGRVDLAKYAYGLKTCRNFIVQRHGGVANRPGTGFVAEVGVSSKVVRLIPFVFNTAQTYVLEFGDQYMRVHKAGAQLAEAAKNITGATNADPCVITITSHGYSNGDEVYISGVGGMTELNGRNFKVANVAANTFELQEMDGTNLDATGYGTYTSGGTAEKVYEISTPYLEADLGDLVFVQSADIITITHPSYAVRDLSRTGDISWTLAAVTFGSSLSAPTGLASDSSGTAHYYTVTAVDGDTGDESLPATEAGSTSRTSTLSWNVVSGADYYNVYYKRNGIFGFIGVAGTNSFTDATYVEDLLDNPPEDRGIFASSDNYPSAVGYYQQRQVYGNTNNNPEGVWTSKTGLRKNFNKSTPLQDDDPVTFTIFGRKVNSIKHFLDLSRRLVIFTANGEWVAEGVGGVLTPTDIGLNQETENGSGSLAPLVVGGSALYVQARGSVIRDLAFDYQTEGYRGNELTIFSNHLFDNYTLVDWAYQQIPNSIVWVVRDDGVLLGLTYVREHQVFAWHRHDFDGLAENVCVVPEGTEDVLYVVVKRTINGKTVRYIERMETRQIVDIEDAIFLDSSLSYDGTNAGATTMTLSGGTTWEYDENLTLTASAAFFASTDVGNAIHLTGADGTLLRCEIVAYTSTTVVTVRSHKTVPSGMRNVAILTWGKAVDEVGGLWHLEGENVSAFADGFVAANPNNSSYTIKTVTNGTVTLDRPYVKIHVGLPITSDLETLNIDLPGVSSMSNERKLIDEVTMFVESTRGLFAGPDSDTLQEAKLRSTEDYDSPVALQTGPIDIKCAGRWDESGKVFIRQIDPVPASILTILPTGYISGP